MAGFWVMLGISREDAQGLGLGVRNQGEGISRMQAGAEVPHAAGGHTHRLALLQESSFSTD